MRLFIANRVGTGTKADPYRPDVDVAAVGGRLGSFEVTANRFLCVAPNATTTPAGAIDLGDLVAERLSGQRLNRIANALDLTTQQLADLTIGEALAVYLGSNLRPYGRRKLIRIAGVDLLDTPATQTEIRNAQRRRQRLEATHGPLTATNTDTFTYSNGALATVSSGTWVTQTGAASQFNVASNAITTVAGNFHCNRYATTYGTDHYSQLVCTASSSEIGIVTRLSTGALDGFFGYIHTAGSADIYRISAGSFTQLDTSTGNSTSAVEMRLESIGSVHTLYHNDIEICTATDAAHASNTSIGGGADFVEVARW